MTQLALREEAALEIVEPRATNHTLRTAGAGSRFLPS
jgi:hypothetical protein